MLPCAAGFRESADGDVATCEPFPESGREACAGGSIHAPGAPGCATIGAACVAGEVWGPVFGSDPIAFVRAGAAPGGDGSMSAPFATIAEALAAPVPPAVIALAAGTYAETITLPASTTLRGVCTTRTVLAPPASAGAPALRVTGAGASVHDLTIEGGSPAVVVDDGATLEMTGVAVMRSSGAAIVARAGARLVASGLVVHDTAESETGPGHALDVDGAAVEIRRASIARATEHAITVRGPSASLLLDRADVRETQSRSADRTLGQGMQIDGGATVVVEASVFDGNRDKAIRVDGAGSSLRVVASVVRDTIGREADGNLGFGIAVANGATAEIDRVVVERNATLAVAVQHAGSVVSVVDSVVRDTRPNAAGESGHGVDAQNGARLVLTRVAILRSTSSGVFASQDASVVAEDLVVRDTRVRPADGSLGYGVRAKDVARVGVFRALVERSHTGGIVASAVSAESDVGPQIELEDVVVDDTRPSSDGTNGAGIANAAGVLVARRVVVARSHGSGIIAGYRAGSTTLEDVRVADTEPQVSDGALGTGIVVFYDHGATLLRVAIERTRAVGLWSAERGAIAGSHVSVVATGESDCTGCDRGGFGAAAHMATLSLADFAVTDNALCGVAVGLGGEVDLARGRIERNPIGANVQPVGYDLTRISRDVVFRENGIPLDTAALALPAVSFVPPP